jgi:tetratricopeptide (TPR) repeat protein
MLTKHAVIMNVACLVVSLITTFAFAEDDQVYLRRGAGIGGIVKDTTTTQLTVESEGKTQTIDVNQIRLVNFGDEPSELRQGRARAAAGKYEDALNSLTRIAANSIEREIVKRDLQFYLALCEGKIALSKGGDKGKAKEAMMAFVRAVPKSHHFFEAAQVLGDLSVGQGDFAEAVKFYSAISAKAPWPEYKLSATMAEARALIAQDNFAAAQAKFELVGQDTSDAPDAKRQRLLAEVGRARCLAETGSAPAGIQLLEQIIADHEPTDDELFGRAYNALGDCLQKAGQSKEALMAYLHVDVLFYSDPEIHAECLYHLSKLWETANKPDRAASSRAILDSRYSGSRWAKAKR